MRSVQKNRFKHTVFLPPIFIDAHLQIKLNTVGEDFTQFFLRFYSDRLNDGRSFSDNHGFLAFPLHAQEARTNSSFPFFFISIS